MENLVPGFDGIGYLKRMAFCFILSFIFDQQELTCLFLLSLFTSITLFVSFFSAKEDNKLGKQVSMIYLGTRVVCLKGSV